MNTRIAASTSARPIILPPIKAMTFQRINGSARLFLTRVHTSGNLMTVLSSNGVDQSVHVPPAGTSPIATAAPKRCLQAKGDQWSAVSGDGDGANDRGCRTHAHRGTRRYGRQDRVLELLLLDDGRARGLRRRGLDRRRR